MSDYRSPPAHSRSALPRLLLSMATLLLLAFTGLAQAQADVSAIPSSFSTGARIRVNVTGLALNTNYRIRLEEVRPGVQDFDLLNFSSGSTTSKALSVAIPNVVPGRYEITLSRVQLGVTRIAATPVTVVAGLGVTLTPSTGAPGRRISFTVNNLVNGTLRVKYAGQTILGPVSVGTSYSGRFVVPSDRPASLPATVPIVFENMLGRLVTRSVTVNFQALAPSNLPRLGFQQPQVPTTQISPRASFPISGRLADGFGQVPTGEQSVYFIGGGVTVPMDSSSAVAGDGTLQMTARAPDADLDGISKNADRVGQVVLVNQGVDGNTGSRRNGRYSITGSLPTATIDGHDSNGGTFTVVVKGALPGGARPLLQGAIVYAEPKVESAFFGFLSSGIGSPSAGQPTSGQQLYQSSLPNQFTDYEIYNRPIVRPENYGCPNTYFRKITSAQGRASFVFGREQLNELGGFAVNSCDFRPCDNNKADSGSSAKGFNQTASFLMSVASGHLGYRSTVVEIGLDGDTGEFFNITTGTPFVNNTTEVLLDPSLDQDFDLRHLLIDGVGPADRHYPLSDCGNQPFCYDDPIQFKSMYVYPNTTKWPLSAFDALNSGRKARLTIDTAAYGPVTFGRIRIGNTAWANFATTGTTPGCVLDADPEVAQGMVEYIATLPDLTRLPAGVVNGTVELRFGQQQTRTFNLQLFTEQPSIEATNPNVRTLRINALTDNIAGTYNIPGLSIPVDSPGHGVGRLDNQTVNDGDFSLKRAEDGLQQSSLMSMSANDVAANDGGIEEASGAFFGFTDGTNTVPKVNTLFETGIIPLFRYTFGFPPIADATLGADFWLAATLAYYGQLKPEGMNATIDPRLAGGINIFFDLDLLFGLASASISAESELGIAMRAKINQGGLAHLTNNPSPPPGKCFTFDLDAVWEACAVGICAGGRENVIAVREPSGCASSAITETPLMLRGITDADGKAAPNVPDGFDLLRPRYTATALGGDGRGHAVTVGVRDNGDLTATHVSGGVVEASFTIDRGTVAVQHIDVAYYATDRAIAVWSENRQTVAQVRALIQTQGGRAFDDIVRTQRLRFSQWNGTAWSSPADLTSVGSDGKAQLAGCPGSPRFDLNNPCPSGGEITAVWERDANQNLDAPDIEIWSSRWKPDGRGWSVAQRVSTTGISSDMLPNVAYRNGVPIVAWARNPGGAFANLRNRHIAYRFLDGSAQVNATTLGNSVGWIDIGVSPSDDVVLAYTVAQSTTGFVGNRQALHSARATSCSAGVCSFLSTEIRDPKGRQVRVERPRVAFDESDTPIVGFRALGYGPDAQGHHSLPGDLPGIMLGTGELAMVRVNSFAQSTYTAQLAGLSDDGLQHWKPDFVYDESMGSLLAVSMQAQAPVGLSTPMAIAKLMSPEGSTIAPKASELGDGAMLRMASGGPDFEIRNAALSRSVISSGQSVILTVDLVNRGANYVPADHGSLKIIASLNGPAGAATLLTSFNQTTVATTNSSRQVVMVFSVPAGVVSDELQTIFIDIVAGEEANAVDATSDHDRIEVNAMPSPIGVNAAVRADSPFVHLTWVDPADTRVFGWRIWKLDANGDWFHLGSTRSPGYVDISAEFATPQTYRIASYSANGMESIPSASITGTVFQTRGDGIFGNGFELGAP